MRAVKKARKSTDPNVQPPKKKGKGKSVEGKKKNAKEPEWESDDSEGIENMKAEDEGWSDLESDQGGVDHGLEQARSLVVTPCFFTLYTVD